MTRDLTRPCIFPNCVGRPYYAKGMCVGHYHQDLKGQPLRPLHTKRPKGAPAKRDDLGRKQCSHCAEWLPETAFHASTSTSDGFAVHCRTCAKSLRRKCWYGLDQATFDAVLAAQGGRCATCGTTEPDGHGWVVDHDHSCCPSARTCGACVRGILCGHCNRALGAAKDSIPTLWSMIRYLSEATA